MNQIDLEPKEFPLGRALQRFQVRCLSAKDRAMDVWAQVLGQIYHEERSDISDTANEIAREAMRADLSLADNDTAKIKERLERIKALADRLIPPTTICIVCLFSALSPQPRSLARTALRPQIVRTTKRARGRREEVAFISESGGADFEWEVLA